MSRRKLIGDVVGDAPAEAPEIPARQVPAADGKPPAAEAAPPAARRRASRGERAGKASQASPRTRPAARDLAAPARPSVAREALKVDVPADLALVQRLHRCRLDTGMDIRDQVAIAVDEWLIGQGY